MDNRVRQHRQLRTTGSDRQHRQLRTTGSDSTDRHIPVAFCVEKNEEETREERILFFLAPLLHRADIPRMPMKKRPEATYAEITALGR